MFKVNEPIKRKLNDDKRLVHCFWSIIELNYFDYWNKWKWIQTNIYYQEQKINENTINRTHIL